MSQSVDGENIETQARDGKGPSSLNLELEAQTGKAVFRCITIIHSPKPKHRKEAKLHHI